MKSHISIGPPAGNRLHIPASTNHNCERAMMRPLGSLSLEQLAESALEEELVDRVDLEGNVVTIIQGGNTFRLPRSQASTFLIGMLRGRSWNVADPRGIEPGQAPDVEGAPDAKGAAGLEEGERREEDAGRMRIDHTLDALLPLGRKTGIIQGYQVNERTRVVRIDISACSSVLSYLDAARYLLDCVRHEVESSASDE